MPLYTAITQEGTVYLRDQDVPVCDGHSRIRTYDFHRVKVQRKGPDEQSKGRNDCTLDIGIVNVRKWSYSVPEIS